MSEVFSRAVETKVQRRCSLLSCAPTRTPGCVQVLEGSLDTRASLLSWKVPPHSSRRLRVHPVKTSLSLRPRWPRFLVCTAQLVSRWLKALLHLCLCLCCVASWSFLETRACVSFSPMPAQTRTDAHMRFLSPRWGGLINLGVMAQWG